MDCLDKKMKMYKIVEVLRKELAEGKYPVGSKFSSEYALAERFSVNKTTANKAVAVLVNSGLLCRSVRGGGTRVVKELEFPKGQIAFFGRIDANYTAHLVAGASEAAFARRYVVSILFPPLAHLHDYLETFSTMPFQGILSYGYGVMDIPDKIPAMYLNTHFLDSDTKHGSVACDDYEGARQIVKAAWRAGHRKIAFFLTDYAGISGNSILNGFRKSLEELGIFQFEPLFFRGEIGNPGSAKRVLPKIFERIPDVSCILTQNDNDAVFLISEIMRNYPEKNGKIVVSGFGTLTAICNRLYFPSVNQHLNEIGARAAETLIDMIENGIPEKPERHLFPPTIVNEAAFKIFEQKE